MLVAMKREIPDPRPENRNCKFVSFRVYSTLTIAFLQKLAQEKGNEASNKQLDDDQKTNSSTNVTWVSIHASQDIHNGLRLKRGFKFDKTNLINFSPVQQ